MGGNALPEHELKAQILIQIREHMQKAWGISVISQKDSIQLKDHMSRKPFSIRSTSPAALSASGFRFGRILLQDLKRNERHHYGKRIRPDPHHERTDQYERTVCQGQGMHFEAVRSTGYGSSSRNSPRSRSKTRPSSARVTNSA